MRVKLLIALALASVFILAGSLQATAIGELGPSGTVINVATPNLTPAVPAAIVTPCISFPATSAPNVNAFGAVNVPALCPPALQTSIKLSAPCVMAFTPPNFVCPILSPPAISAFSFTAPKFIDP